MTMSKRALSVILITIEDLVHTCTMREPVNDLADNLQSAAIFGGTKPYDERE